MEAVRASLERSLRQIGLEPVVCEDRPPAGGESPEQRSIDLVEKCDVFVGIVGHRYGSCPPGDTRSYTEIEFDAARSHESEIEILMFIQDGAHAQQELGRADDLDSAYKQFRLRNKFVDRIDRLDLHDSR